MSRKESLHKYNTSEKGKLTQLKYRRTKKGKELSRRAKLKYYYDLTTDDYNELLQNQGGCCAVCGKHQSKLKRRFDIDHDHTTGKVRGLLCGGCNRHLELFINGREYSTYYTIRFSNYIKGV